MLETILAIPIFMLLIGGMLWIGDLCVVKQKLMVADRYVAWNIGNCHRQLQTTDQLADEVNAFVAGIPGQSFRVRSKSLVTIDWKFWSQNSGGVRGQVNMPDWVKGWLAAGQIMSTSSNSIDAEAFLHARDLPEDNDADPDASLTYEGHVVIMRSGTSREANGVALVNLDANGGPQPWQGIVDEEWPQP